MEFLIRNFDSTNQDEDIDRLGCRKRGMCDAQMPDGHIWGNLEGLPRFVVIKCPEIKNQSELGFSEGLMKPWKDEFDYEIMANRPQQGEYDIRIFEINKGLNNKNAITNKKATRVKNYLTTWGCSNFSMSSTDGTFTFSLWNAVRSANFWEVPLDIFTNISFSLNSYTSASGIANITITITGDIASEKVASRIMQRGGSIVNITDNTVRFTITRTKILEVFKEDIKKHIQQVYMFQRHRIKKSIVDQAEAAGGIITLTKSALLEAINDSMAE